jgi:GNAT superfamily N-acetyltransferase
MALAYPPGIDALVDRIRSAGVLTRFALQHLLLPLYFAREQGWAVAGERGEMAAIMYLRRQERQGIRVLHIDDINVDVRSRGRGLAQRLMLLAEELAHQEQRPFLKLAVTVANTPAVTLYRRLGYQEQHHRYFTFVPASAPKLLMPLPQSTDLRLRALSRRQAAAALHRVQEIELRASVPQVADLLAAYYPLRVVKGATQRYAIEQRGQQIGYGDVYRRGGRWNLDLGLHPNVWGTEIERQAIELLTHASEQEDGYKRGSAVALHVPSAAHFEALFAEANALGLVVQNYDRMVMVKVIASGS